MVCSHAVDPNLAIEVTINVVEVEMTVKPCGPFLAAKLEIPLKSNDKPGNDDLTSSAHETDTDKDDEKAETNVQAIAESGVHNVDSHEDPAIRAAVSLELVVGARKPRPYIVIDAMVSGRTFVEKNRS